MEDTQADSIAYFGYGSLVNLATLQTPFISAQPALLKGWKRVWLSRPQVEGSFAPFSGLAFLSVKPSSATTIEGMLVEDYSSSLSALDAREALYDRVQLKADNVELIGPDQSKKSAHSFLYVAQPDPQTLVEQPQILRSYLDVVFKGYLDHFGEDALVQFVETTENFYLGVLEDRDSPIYPRSVKCTDAELKLFDNVVPQGGLKAL